MNFDTRGLETHKLIELYTEMLYPRMIEEKMLKMLRQGRVSKWFSGIGQEAISVAAASATDSDEYILPMHRNLGVFTTRGIPLQNLLLQWRGKKTGFTKGRDRSFHFGTAHYHIWGMISHLGPQLSVGDGIALASKLDNRNKLTIAFTGEGGTSQGEFHEALNLASVWDLPILFIVENNGYALSTPTDEQFRCHQLAEKGAGYGMRAETVDGNNILDMYHAVADAKKYCVENNRPMMLECMTFRMRGHEEASGTKYVPQQLMDHWASLDPIANYEYFLLEQGILTQTDKERISADFKDEIDITVEQVMTVPDFEAEMQDELEDIYCRDDAKMEPAKGPETELKFIEAIRQGLDQCMTQHPELILMGQDIADYGGVFKVTEGMMEKYGEHRVRNTPLCESAVLGAGIGMSILGKKAMVEMQFSDFVSCGFNQIVNNAAKLHYRWGQNADLLIRMPTGAGVAAGPFHSQSTEAWFTHTPGLKVLYPSDPYTAKGLLSAGIADPNPVLFFEHKALYRSISGPVPENYYQLQIGKARCVREGEDFSIITYGMGVHWALELAEQNPEWSIYILDLLSLAPLDYEAITRATMATSKVLVLHEDSMFGGLGGEIAAWIAENHFEHLDAPILRCASLDTPIPFVSQLEKQYLANSRLQNYAEKLMQY